MKVTVLDPAGIICMSQYDGGASQSLDDIIDDTPSVDGTFRPSVIFD